MIEVSYDSLRADFINDLYILCNARINRPAA